MLRLIYGTSAAREKIYAEINEKVSGKGRAYLIVPDQKVLVAESALAKILPPSAPLYFDVVGFSRLSNLVCRKYGRLTYSYASDGARVIFMYRAQKLLKPELKVFGKEPARGTLSSLCSLRTEMRGADVSPEKLYEVANALAPSALSDKLFDLSLLFSMYDSLLHEKYAEAADDIDTLCDLLRDKDFFGDAHIYIDSFASFTKKQLTVISRMLAKKNNVTVSIPYSKSGSADTAEARDTRIRLMKLARDAGADCEELYAESLDAPPALNFAKKNIWNYACTDTFDKDINGALSVFSCDDRRSEASLCALEIFKAVSGGMSYSDIVVIVRNAVDYNGVIDKALKRSEIPFFFAKKTNAERLPLTKMILSAFALYIYNFPLEDVVSYIKTGLCGLSDDECDIFEEYISRWNINGKERYLDGEDFTMSRDGYTSAEVDMDSLSEINGIKKRIMSPLARFCDTLQASKTVRDFACAVYEYLADCKIMEACLSKTQTKYFGVDRSADAVRLWNVTVEALDTLVATAGDEVTTAQEFSELLVLLFSNIEISRIPTSVDGVTVGTPDTVKMDKCKLVIILGVNDGVFPAPTSESPALCENERRIMKEAGAELSASLELCAARELLGFVRAMDFATERAVISYHTQGADGKLTEPSFAIERLFRIFGDKVKAVPFSDISPIDRIFSVAGTKDAVGRFGKDADTVLRTFLSEAGETVPPTAGEVTNRSVAISPETAKSLFGDKMVLSQSRLDCYSSCHFKYYFDYMLSVSDSEPFKFNPASKGTYVHGILETFMRDAHAAGRKISAYTEEEIKEISVSLCRKEAERVMRSGGGGRARMEYFFMQMQKNIELILTNLCNEFANTSFEPMLFEYNIGLGGGHKMLSVTLPDDSTVSLCGIADRIDILRRDGKTYIRIVDYKTGSKKFSENDLTEGKNLQLLIYLYTLCKVVDEGFFDLVGVRDIHELVPAGAVYFVVKTPNFSLDAPPEDLKSVLQSAEKKLGRSGIILDMEELEKAADKTAKGEFSKSLNKKSTKQMEELFNTVTESIKSIALCMRQGEINCENTAVGEETPCRYCKFSPACRDSKI